MPNISYNFKGKVVLITGSASGIGAETALLFAKAGAEVVLTDINETKLEEMAEQCQQLSQNKTKPHQVVADITKQEDITRLVVSTIKTHGKLDILVNNAGCFNQKEITDPEYMQLYDKLMDINLKSLVYLTHLCVEHLAKTKGNVINISSAAAVTPDPKMSIYCMTKIAVDMFTKCMAAELGPQGIRVNSINCGGIKTCVMKDNGLDEYQWSQLLDKFSQNLPVRRAGLPQDIGNTILFLASNEGSFMTGSNVLVDGGHVVGNVPYPSV